MTGPGILRPRPSRAAGIAASIGIGLGVGLLGTALHGHAWFGADAVLPYGALGALLLLAAGALWVGLWARSAWYVVLTGFVVYACVGAFSIQRGAAGLVSSNLQGVVWLYGIAVVTPLTALLGAWLLGRARR
ncbi:hypothetical protein [Specibacter cremeus]|uniref:hypothetical protein n=1 Tax=Specibacter cremeus TaxID=1629051 RepID=UPI000F783446|nr:hypothetical protein [Specibacter cremeus]